MYNKIEEKEEMQESCSTCVETITNSDILHGLKLKCSYNGII